MARKFFDNAIFFCLFGEIGENTAIFNYYNNKTIIIKPANFDNFKLQIISNRDKLRYKFTIENMK